MLGKLTWDAIPFDQPIPMVASGVVALAILAILGWVVVKGHLPYLWREWITSVDHKRIGVMYTLLAMVMLLRGFTDAIMMRAAAVARLPGGGLPAAGTLRPGVLGARHHHDLLCRHAVHDRADEFRGAAAARRPRRRLSDAQLGRLLADLHRRAAGQHLAHRRRIRAHRLAALSAAVGTGLFARRRRRLLSVVARDLRRRHAGRRHQPRHHRAEDTHQGHEPICACRCSAGPRWRPIC